MKTLIIPFRREDASAFARLNRAWLVEHNLLEEADERQLSDPERYFITPGGQIFVAVQASDVVGTCAVVPQGSGTVELAKLVVAPAAQGQGLGRRLVDVALAHARQLGAIRVMLTSSSHLKAALRLYERVGFRYGVVPSEVPYATADVYMELDLTDDVRARP